MGSSSLSFSLTPLPLHRHRHHHRRVSLDPSFFPFPPRSLPIRAVSGGPSHDPETLRRPVPQSVLQVFEEEEEEEEEDHAGGYGGEKVEQEKIHRRDKREVGRRRRKNPWDADWIDKEDQILEDTVPLVGFARMILHSGKYVSGDRLSPEHEKLVLELLLMHHPEHEEKMGCGIDYFTIGYHPKFQSSRCLFVVRKDGTSVDFSYWKCIKNFVRKKYPLFADAFILRHFSRPRISD